MIHAKTTQPASNVYTEETYEQPMLARSASVREPGKPHNAVSPVGGLQQKHGHIDQSEQDRQRDAKRRTVQVEYVAPQSQTARGDKTSTVAATAGSQSTPRTRVRAEQGPTEIPNSDGYQSSTTRSRAQQPGSNSVPTTRPHAETQRAASDMPAYGQSPPQVNPTSASARPSTGGTLSGSRLPSRGNSYGQPVAATVAPHHAQGHVSQPKSKQYVISAPMPHSEPVIGEPSIGRPSIGRAPSSGYGQQAAVQEIQTRNGHKRSSTMSGLGEKLFGRTSMFSGRPSTDQSRPPREDKKYPPVSLNQSFTTTEEYQPRKSNDSGRRVSFGFGRKQTHESNASVAPSTKPERSSRRFSLLPSLKAFGGGGSGGVHKDQIPPGTAQSMDDRRFSSKQPPRSRGDSTSRPSIGMAFGRGTSRSPSQSTTGSTIPVLYDGNLDSAAAVRQRRESPAQQMRSIPTSAPAGQTAFPTSHLRNETTNNYGYPEAPTSAPRQFGSVANTNAYYHANDSEASQPVVPLPISKDPQYENVGAGNGNGSRYPPGFNSDSFDNVHADRKGVLQKSRKFADAYETGDKGHAGSTGAGRRVMDIFRRIGKARGKDER
jgi:protein-serine/threonine kinase